MSDPAPDREPAPSTDITIVLRPGERLGPLRLVRELGLGGQGVVYEAVRESDGLIVAAKILRTDVHLSDDLIERFEREAQAAQRLHHENIVAVHGMVEWQGFRVILQELVTGGSLDDAIKARHGQRDRTGTDDCRWAAGLCRDLALALQHAHDSHVVHRDIKPGNVLLTPGGVPKITDFGLAKVEDLFGLTQTGDRMGTPNYMSPEQVEAAHGGVDSRTDIYSLAAVLYRMLSRRVPFQADNLTTLFRDILTRAPTPPRKLQPGVPRDLQAVCLKALHKAPADRYATAREFAADLQRFLDGKSTLARPEGAVVQATRALSHLAISTLAVVALLVPVGWLLVDLLLRLAAKQDVGMHSARVAAVGLAALVLAWPLSLLGLRLSRGRRWTVAAAWALAVVLGTLGGRVIWGQRAEQIHGTEREALAHTIDFEGLGERREVDDLQAFSARWESRLDAEDFLLLGRGYLKRLRPAQAEDWARRLEAARAESPDSQALMLAVADALGDDARTTEVAGRLWQAPQEGQGWSEWNRAGDVLSDVHRYEDANRAYTLAAKRPDADQFRDLLNLKMAQVSSGLCKYAEADDYLNDYMKWKPDDARANEIAVTIARKTADWKRADKHLATLQAGGRESWATFVHNRFEVLTGQDKQKVAQDFVDQVALHEFTDFSVLDWCATRAYDGGRFDEAEGIWKRMAELKPESATPHIGLSNVYYERGEVRKSADAARRAIELDPLFFQSYYNLALALHGDLLQQRGGDESKFSVADFSTILEPFKTTLRYDGLQPDALNNTAYIIAQMVKKDPGSASLDEADTLLRRSIRVLERGREGECKLADPELSSLAQAYDTLRDVEEIKGHTAEALAAARSALESLPPKDFPDYQESFTQHVQRLETQLAGR